MIELCLKEFFKKEDKIRKKLEQYAFKGRGAEEIARSLMS